MVTAGVIRGAMAADIPRLVELGRRALLEGPYRDLLADRPEVATKLARRMLTLAQARILVWESPVVSRQWPVSPAAADRRLVTGLFAFLLAEHHFSGEPVAAEMIWYVEPEARVAANAGMELLWAAEALAAELGAIWMQLSAPAGSPEIAALYSRLKGYVPVEAMYQRKIAGRELPVVSSQSPEAAGDRRPGTGDSPTGDRRLEAGD